MQGETSTHRAMLKQGVRVRPKYHKKGPARDTRHVSHNEIRHWGVRKFRRKFRHPTGFARSPRKFRPFKCTWRSCLAWQFCNTKIDVVLAGLNDTPSGSLLGLSSMAYGEGTLDEEELILLGLGLEIGDGRSYFALPQEIPVRLLLVLDEGTFLSTFRFTQRQVEAIHGALALPADFERERRAPQDGLSTRIAECMQIPTRTVNESVVRQKLVFRASSGEYSFRASLGLRLMKNFSGTSLCERSLLSHHCKYWAVLPASTGIMHCRVGAFT